MFTFAFTFAFDPCTLLFRTFNLFVMQRAKIATRSNTVRKNVGQLWEQNEILCYDLLFLLWSYVSHTKLEITSDGKLALFFSNIVLSTFLLKEIAHRANTDLHSHHMGVGTLEKLLESSRNELFERKYAIYLASGTFPLTHVCLSTVPIWTVPLAFTVTFLLR